MQPPLSNDEELEQSLIQLETFSLTHEEFEILENAIISKYLCDRDHVVVVLLDLLCRPSLQRLPSGRSREEILRAHLPRFVPPVLPTGAQLPPIERNGSQEIVERNGRQEIVESKGRQEVVT